MWSHQLGLHRFREEMRTTHLLPYSLSFAECVANRRATTFHMPQGYVNQKIHLTSQCRKHGLLLRH